MRSQMVRIVLAGVVLLTPVAFAQAGGRGNPTGGRFAHQHPRRNEVNQRISDQRYRINQGLDSSKLTQTQANRLRANDNAIKKQEHADVRANGGYLTKAEQRQFNQEENANSTLIRDEKHPAAP